MPLTRNIYLHLIVATIIFFSNRVNAQTQLSEHKIYGTIADSLTKKPLELLTVQLRPESDTIVKTSLTKADGSFLFTGLKPLKYQLQIVAVGYNSKTIPVDYTDSTKNSTHLGIIYISNRVNMLGEVVVTARKPIIKQEIDRVTYDFQADPESKASNVLEMMRKVPFLSLDGDGNVLLNGSSNYKILINGKPSSMIEWNAKDLLRSMPASTIKSIEVITNPSSKYDAEGLAGIINIITNKKADNGYNGTINLSHKFQVGGPGAGVSFAFKQGKFGMSVLGGSSQYQSPKAKNSISRTAKGNTATNLDQYSAKESDSKSAYISAELSYDVDSLNLISAQFNVNSSRTHGISNQNALLYGNSRVLQQYNLTNSGKGNGYGVDASLNYQLGFKSSKERLLTFSYRYFGYTNDQYNDLNVSNPINYANPDYNQTNNGIASEHTLQLDYVQRVDKLNIEGGIKSILRTNKSDFQYRSFDSSNGKFELDPARTNLYHNYQNVFAAYNTYQYNLESWGFKGGVRIEQTSIDADFISTATLVEQKYLSIIPSAVINRKFKDKSSLTLAFTNRIQRPGINQLNPFVDRSNPNFELAGNPNLKPAYSNLIQISYNKSKKASLNIALGYISSNGLIGPVTAYDSATNITRTTFENIGKARVLKTNIYMSYPITEKWNVRLNSDIRYVLAKIMVNGVLIKNEGLMEYLNISSGYRFDKGWRLNADVTVNSGGVSSIQGKTNGFTSSSFSIQKELVKSNLTFSATLSNPFTKYRQGHEEIFGPDFMQISSTQTYYRSFGFSVNYRFGKLKEAVKKNKRGIRNDDVSN